MVCAQCDQSKGEGQAEVSSTQRRPSFSRRSWKTTADPVKYVAYPKATSHYWGVNVDRATYWATEDRLNLFFATFGGNLIDGAKEDDEGKAKGVLHSFSTSDKRKELKKELIAMSKFSEVVAIIGKTQEQGVVAHKQYAYIQDFTRCVRASNILLREEATKKRFDALFVESETVHWFSHMRLFDPFQKHAMQHTGFVVRSDVLKVPPEIRDEF